MMPEQSIEKVTLAVCRDCGGAIDVDSWECGAEFHRTDDCRRDDTVVGVTFVRADDVVAALEEIYEQICGRANHSKWSTFNSGHDLWPLEEFTESLKKGQDD